MKHLNYRKHKRAALGLSLLLGLSLGSQSAFSATQADEIAALKSHLSQLTQRLSELESSQKQTDDILARTEPQLKVLENLPEVQVGSKGLQFASPDGNYTFRLDGGFQQDGRWFLDGPDDADTFDTRRFRPSIRGTLFDSWDWRLQYETDNNSLFDAYIRYTHSPLLKIKVGRQKTSIGLERLQGFAHTPFAERGIQTNLTPPRDNGIQLSGKLLDSSVLYELGLFNGAENDGRPDTDGADSKTVSGRLFFTPWAKDKDSALSGLGFGIAVSHGDEEGAAIPRYRTYGRQTFFNYEGGTAATGDHTRINPQLSYYNGKFGLLAEAIFDEQTFTRGGVESDIDTYSWAITPSYVLTGGTNGFGGVKLDKGAALHEGGKGAWLLAGRVAYFEVDDDVFEGTNATRLGDPNSDALEVTSYSASLSWHPDPNVRLSFSLDHSEFDEGADRDDETVFVTRLQVAF